MRLAVVGIPRDPKEFGQRLYADLRQWGYDAVPVSPHLTSVGDAPVYSRVQDIQPGVDAALLLTSPALNEQIVADCAEAGVKRVWFYGVSDRSRENEAAIRRLLVCRESDEWPTGYEEIRVLDVP